MPRLSPHLFHRARHIHCLLPTLLRTTRDLGSARNELRWLKEHALARAASGGSRLRWRTILARLCTARGLGRPLQYILGNEYFGDLEIRCRPGVLIPRQETAASVHHLVKRLTNPPRSLRVLDLCTGTGCIPLLFQHDFYRLHPRHDRLQVLGIDVSDKAIALSNENLERQVKDRGRLLPVDFAKADVLVGERRGEAAADPDLKSVLLDHDRGNTIETAQTTKWDIIISNPPYISPESFNHTTARSVRTFEPRLALVPQMHRIDHELDPGDLFYPRLLKIAEELQSKVVLFEVADMEQAQRVALMMTGQGIWTRVEIWRDDPDHDGHSECSVEENRPFVPGIRVIGSGNGRSVFAWRGEACQWFASDIATLRDQ